MPSKFISLSHGHPRAELVNIAQVNTTSHRDASAVPTDGSPRVADDPIVETRDWISSVTHNVNIVTEPVRRQVKASWIIVDSGPENEWSWNAEIGAEFHLNASGPRTSFLDLYHTNDLNHLSIFYKRPAIIIKHHVRTWSYNSKCNKDISLLPAVRFLKEILVKGQISSRMHFFCIYFRDGYWIISVALIERFWQFEIL